MKHRLLIITLLFFAIQVQAQDENGVIRCASDEMHAIKMQDPAYAQQHAENEQRLQLFLQDRGGERLPDCPNVLLIPVAAHFQNTGIPIDCARQMAVDQVERMNLDFAGANADIGDWTAAQGTFPGINNGESCIQFCLATLNHPAGFGLAEGDIAVTLDVTTGDNDPAWAGYLNFWVRDLGGGILGYSPLGGNGNGDGVACTTTAFSSISCGGNTISATYNLGRTMTHEVGHFLNLEHPWGGGGCASTDFVADTPVTDNPTFGCPAIPTVTCTDPALTMSYMDYTDDQCMFMFSAGQIERAEAHVNANLMNALDLSTTVCQEAACATYEVTYSTQNESCPGNDASINITVVDGNPPYEFSINAGASSQSLPNFNGLGSGQYDIYVIDATDCLFEQNVTLTQASAPVDLISTTSTWCGNDSGSVMVNVPLPGAFEYSIDGINWQGSPLFEYIPAGTYQVIARNAAGCTGYKTVTVEDENDLDIEVAAFRNVNCPFTPNGMIQLALGGGVPPFEFSIDEVGQTFPVANFTELTPGEHVIYLSDARDCDAEYRFEIFESFGSFDADCPCTVYIPSAITADGDGINEHLDVVPSCPFANYSLQVFDRWGQTVFETIDPGTRWNGGGSGTEYYVNDGLYFYKVRLTWGAEVGSANTEEFVGSVMVIR